MEEMVDVLQALVRLPPCTGRGVALVGGAGGTSVAATDICARAGLSVPTVTEETQRELRTFIGVAGTSVQNPLDIGMQLRGPEDLIHVLEVVVKDPQIDLILMVVYVFPRGVPWSGGARDMLRPLLRFARGSSHRQPFAVAIRSPAENREAETDRLRTTRAFLAADVPVFKTVERACRALYKYTGYYRSLQERQAP
jgi:acyl-CoA synthetase (NDP forming)